VPWTAELSYDDWRGEDPIKLAGGFERVRPAASRVGDAPAVLNLDLVEADAEWLAAHGGPRIVDWDNVGLGQRSDADVAASLGLSTPTVASRRTDRGILPYRTTRINKLGNVDQSLLGSVPDSAIAARHNCDSTAVAALRAKLGIPSFRVSKHAVDWTLLRLGERSDSEVAREISVPISVVNQARRRMGIPRYSKLGAVKGLLASRLGNLPDVALAREFGVNTKTVCAMRVARGILPARPSRPG
jgi:hypothetical protein